MDLSTKAEVTEDSVSHFRFHNRCMEDDARAPHPQTSFPPYFSPIEDRKGR